MPMRSRANSWVPSVCGDRAQPVVPGESSAELELQSSRLEVELVVDDDELA